MNLRCVGPHPHKTEDFTQRSFFQKKNESNGTQSPIVLHLFPPRCEICVPEPRGSPGQKDPISPSRMSFLPLPAGRQQSPCASSLWENTS